MGVFSNRKVSLSPRWTQNCFIHSLRAPVSTPFLYFSTFELISASDVPALPDVPPSWYGQRCTCLSSEHTGGEVVLHRLRSVYAKACIWFLGDVADLNGSVWGLARALPFWNSLQQWGHRGDSHWAHSFQCGNLSSSKSKRFYNVNSSAAEN